MLVRAVRHLDPFPFQLLEGQCSLGGLLHGLVIQEQLPVAGVLQLRPGSDSVHSSEVAADSRLLMLPLTQCDVSGTG